MYKDVAKEMRLSIFTVKMLMRKLKKNPELLREIYAKQDEKRNKCLAIKKIVEELNDNDTPILSVA
jgi:transposase